MSSISTFPPRQPGCDPDSCRGFALVGLLGVLTFLILLSSSSLAAAQDWVQTGAPFGNWVALASSADGAKLCAAAGGFDNPGPIFTSTNSGQTWTQCSVLAPWTSIASSADGANLVATTGSQAVWTSTNSGATWTKQNGPRYGLYAVTCSADGTKIAGVGESFLYTSSDFGQTWASNSGSNFFYNIAASADGNRLASFAEGNGFLFQFFFSTNSGNSWDEIDGPFSSNSLGTLASSADGTRFVLAVAYVGILTTTNLGATWETSDAPGDTGWTDVACSADGMRMVATTTGISVDLPGSIYTSADSGVSWVEAKVPHTNWVRVASSADGTKLVAAVSQGGIFTWQAPPPPRLDIAFLQGNFVLSWSASSNATLQQSSDLTTANWSPVTAQFVVTNGQYQVVLPPSGIEPGFFRLKSP